MGVTREPVVESDGEAEGHGEAESYGEGHGEAESYGYGSGRRDPQRALSQLWPAAHEGAIRSLVEEQTPLLHRRSL